MKTYNQFIEESQEIINKITSNWERKHPGMKASASITKQGDIQLHKIEVPKEQRGGGIGSRFMKGLTKTADKQGRRITLTPQADKGKKTKLEKFYKSFGFRPNTGRNQDFTTSDSRIRNPNQ